MIQKRSVCWPLSRVVWASLLIWVCTIKNRNSNAQLVGFPDYCIEDFYDVFVAQFETAAKAPTQQTLQQLVQNLNDSGISDALVCYMRFICSGHLQTHQADYAPFLTSHATVTEFCKKQTEVVGCEAEDLHIGALAKEFGVKVVVEYLDANLSRMLYAANKHL